MRKLLVILAAVAAANPPDFVNRPGHACAVCSEVESRAETMRQAVDAPRVTRDASGVIRVQGAGHALVTPFVAPVNAADGSITFDADPGTVYDVWAYVAHSSGRDVPFVQRIGVAVAEPVPTRPELVRRYLLMATELQSLRDRVDAMQSEVDGLYRQLAPITINDIVQSQSLP